MWGCGPIYKLHKLSGIGKNSNVFNKPLVLKSYPVEDGSYRLTVAFPGKKGNDGQSFFENLKQSLSIDESNFHKTILQLIDEKT